MARAGLGSLVLRRRPRGWVLVVGLGVGLCRGLGGVVRLRGGGALAALGRCAGFRSVRPRLLAWPGPPGRGIRRWRVGWLGGVGARVVGALPARYGLIHT
ncbi:MAG: hypothetical protein H0U97_06070 [Gammaproteobacteria bacterium]|nr:hypothetical protein [Gammaproteobacteria bacterium]